MGEHKKKKETPSFKPGDHVIRISDGSTGVVATWRDMAGKTIERPGDWTATTEYMAAMERDGNGFVPFVRDVNGCASWDWPHGLRLDKPKPKLTQLLMFEEGTCR